MKRYEIVRWVMGPLKTNCYMIVSGGEAIVLDVGFPREALEIADFILSRGLKVKMFIATHGHFDHVMGFNALRRRLKIHIPLLIHLNDIELLSRAGEALRKYFGIELAPPKPDQTLDGGEEVSVGDLTFKVIHVPGHTMGSIALYSEEGLLFTGDTLFKRYVGRCDFPESNCRLLGDSIRRLFQLPLETKVYPGHMEETTLEEEFLLNPYVKSVLENW